MLFVGDVHRAAHFYIDTLGFGKQWHADDGAGPVCQVTRLGCEVILCEDAARSGKGRLFISLDADELADLRREIHARAVPAKVTWWGYDTLQIDDPDGNELLFPLDSSSALAAG